MTSEDLAIVEFCAIECELQQSGERSVSWMVQAWDWAMEMQWRTDRGGIAEDDVRMLGHLVEPVKNRKGYRTVGVRVGSDIKPNSVTVPRMMTQLVQHQAEVSPEEWFRQYEEIHPFVDGNGRTGVILYNWLGGTLAEPIWAPNFWDDSRRTKGYGAQR